MGHNQQRRCDYEHELHQTTLGWGQHDRIANFLKRSSNYSHGQA